MSDAGVLVVRAAEVWRLVLAAVAAVAGIRNGGFRSPHSEALKPSPSAQAEPPSQRLRPTATRAEIPRLDRGLRHTVVVLVPETVRPGAMQAAAVGVLLLSVAMQAARRRARVVILRSRLLLRQPRRCQPVLLQATVDTLRRA